MTLPPRRDEGGDPSRLRGVLHELSNFIQGLGALLLTTWLACDGISINAWLDLSPGSLFYWLFGWVMPVVGVVLVIAGRYLHAGSLRRLVVEHDD